MHPQTEFQTNCATKCGPTRCRVTLRHATLRHETCLKSKGLRFEPVVGAPLQPGKGLPKIQFIISDPLYMCYHGGSGTVPLVSLVVGTLPMNTEPDLAKAPSEAPAPSAVPSLLEMLGSLRMLIAQLKLYPKESPQVLKVVTDTYHSIHSFLETANTLTLSKTQLSPFFPTLAS